MEMILFLKDQLDKDPNFKASIQTWKNQLAQHFASNGQGTHAAMVKGLHLEGDFQYVGFTLKILLLDMGVLQIDSRRDSPLNFPVPSV